MASSFPHRSYSSSPSDEEALYYSSYGSTHSRVPTDLFVQTNSSSQRNGYGPHSGDHATEEVYGSHIYSHPNRDARQHHSDRVTQDDCCDLTPRYLQSASTRIGHSQVAFSGPVPAQHHIPQFSQDGLPLSHYTTLAPAPHYHSPPAYTHSQSSSPNAHEALFTPYMDCFQSGGYGQSVRAPQPSGTAFSGNITYLPYAAAAMASGTSSPGHTHTPIGQKCEWDGCNELLSENTCAVIRRHLKDHHFRGSPPSPKTLMACKWGGSCRREEMQWENIPKHVAECHTKAMTRVCAQCGDSFARSDTLKRHTESGNCSRSFVRM